MIFNKSKFNEHWNTQVLSDLGTFQRGKSRHRPRNDKALFENGNHPLVQTGEVKAANLHIRNHTDTYNDFGLAQSKKWPKGTLAITIAANIAETALLGYPMCFPDSVVGFQAHKECSSEIYMHYVFTYIRAAIQNSVSGSIQDNINIDYLTSLEFKVPKKPEQDKIAKVLSTLDAKIELNNRINGELEAMAKLLYDYWFVQFDFPMTAAQATALGHPELEGQPYKTSGGKMVFNPTLKRDIPEGWEAGTAASLFHFNPTESLKGNEAMHFDMACLRTSGFMTDAPFLKKTGGGPKFRNGDVVVARITPCLENGKTGLITRLKDDEIGFGSTELIVMRGRKQPLSGFGVCMARSEYFRKFAILNMTGTSGRKRIEAPILETISIPLPNEDLLNEFEATLAPMLQKMTTNEVQDKELTELRDWLLPMLMNGQVTVTDYAYDKE